jgi:hypothetical protein
MDRMDMMDRMDRMDRMTSESRMKKVMCDDKQEVKSKTGHRRLGIQ